MVHGPNGRKRWSPVARNAGRDGIDTFQSRAPPDFKSSLGRKMHSFIQSVLDGTLQTHSRQPQEKKTHQESVLVQAPRPWSRSADVWVGKKLQSESWPPLTQSQCWNVLLFMLLPVLKLYFLIWELNENLITSSRRFHILNSEVVDRMTWIFNIGFSLTSWHSSWITVSWCSSHPGN